MGDDLYRFDNIKTGRGHLFNTGQKVFISGQSQVDFYLVQNDSHFKFALDLQLFKFQDC